MVRDVKAVLQSLYYRADILKYDVKVEDLHLTLQYLIP